MYLKRMVTFKCGKLNVAFIYSDVRSTFYNTANLLIRKSNLCIFTPFLIGTLKKPNKLRSI